MTETWIEKSYARGRAMHVSLGIIFMAMSLFTLVGGAFAWTLFLLLQGWWHLRANKCKMGFGPVIAYATTAWTFGFSTYLIWVDTAGHHSPIELAFILVPSLMIAILALVQTWISSVFIKADNLTWRTLLIEPWRWQWKKYTSMLSQLLSRLLGR